MGSWAPVQTLSAEERNAFFAKSSGSSSWATLETHLVESLSRERENALTVKVGGKYLPPNVWLAQGFTQEQVDRCEDWEENETLGPCCRLQVKEVSHSSVLRTVRSELVNRVKEVAKNKKDTDKTWDLQASTQSKNTGPEVNAGKQAEKQLAKANKAVLALAAKVLTPVTNNWLQTELALSKTSLSQDEAAVAVLKESHAVLHSWKTACENILAKKENAGEVALTLPFSKEEVDTRVKTVAAALKALKDERKAAKEAAKSAKRAAAATAAAALPDDQQVSKRRRTKGGPTA